MPTSRSSPPARRKAAVLLDPRGPPLLQLQAGRRMELAAASRAAAPKSSRSRPPALQQRKEEPGAAARGSGSSATASSATARRRRAPFLPFFATTCPLPSHPPAPAPVPPRRRRRVVPERGPAAAPPPPSPLLPPPPPWAGGGDASWLGWRRHGGSGPPRGKLERAVGGWRRTEASSPMAPGPSSPRPPGPSSPRPPGPSSPMAPGRAPHGGENFAFAVGDAEILVWNPFTVHDLKHGMGLVFGSSLLEIALHDRLLPRDLSFARSFTCSSDSAMALSSFLPTCQVDTHCAASAPRRAESPPVPFGVDILARSSFASSVSHHKIHKAGLIFELFYKLHRPCPITKSIK